MREYYAKIKGKRGFQKGAEANRYLHCGVREHAIATLNDLAYHSSGLVINVLTHDSIGWWVRTAPPTSRSEPWPACAQSPKCW